ncbi:MAG TPA: class I SAM-dependent methyltransferase [Gaiellaceae bacterium]|nr:class I SAM-dependent methyltransferase [Gaiellaceae bacterium]
MLVLRDPSEPFVAALRERLPGVDARVGSAEALPFADDEFNAALSQPADNFMADPEAGVAEMRRVVRSGGAVAACVWDYPGEMTLLRTFWEAAAALEPDLAAGRDERRCGAEAPTPPRHPRGPFELSARAWYAVGTT